MIDYRKNNPAAEGIVVFLILSDDQAQLAAGFIVPFGHQDLRKEIPLVGSEAFAGVTWCISNLPLYNRIVRESAALDKFIVHGLLPRRHVGLLQWPREDLLELVSI